MKKPKYTESFVDRHGRVRHYLRRPGFKRVPLPGLPWSPEFMDAYSEVMETAKGLNVRIAPGANRSRPGTFNAALRLYFGSVKFTTELAPSSQRSRRNTLERFARQTGEHNTTPRGERPLVGLTHDALAKILANMDPHPRRSALKALRHFAAWARTEGLMQADPTIGMKLARLPKTKGFYSWTDEDIAKFEAAYPVGTTARLAFAIMLYLALRRADAVRIGPQHIRNGHVNFTPSKTANSSGFVLDCPVHPELLRAIDAMPVIGTNTLLLSERGTPYRPNGLSDAMRKWCDAAGLPACSNHGLRKACARRLIDLGMDVVAVAAITGHADLRELQVYIAERDQRLAARRAVAAMPSSLNSEPRLPNPVVGFGNSTKKHRNIIGEK